jgi:hypothetical protein
MKRAVPLRLFLLLGLAVPGVPRNARAENLTFDLYAMGFPVAQSSMSFEVTPAAYRMGLHYHTTGLLKVVAGDRLDQSSSGTFQHDQPVPLEFKSYIRLHSRDRIVTLMYRNGDPTTTAIDPPDEAEREIVPPARREHTLDPLSAMLDMLRIAARSGSCDIRHETYDGRRLEIFTARTAGEEDLAPSGRSIYSGRGLRCDYTSQPIAGLRFGEEHDEDGRARNGTIWLAQVAPGGPRVPVRGLVDVRFLGSAQMYLTAVAP